MRRSVPRNDQCPSPNDRQMTNAQTPMTNPEGLFHWALVIGAWSFVGHWDLVIGAFAHVILVSAWTHQCRPLRRPMPRRLLGRNLRGSAVSSGRAGSNERACCAP